MDKKTIGSRIEDFVYRNSISIQDFADMIHCSKRHVYKIFKKNKMDIQQLAEISKALDYNFFKDLAENYDLAKDVDKEANKAIEQLFKVLPNVLESMGYKTTVYSGNSKKNSRGKKVFDFVLNPFNITFPIEKTLERRAQKYYYKEAKTFEDKLGNKITIETNKNDDIKFCKIDLTNRTEKQWVEVFRFAINTIEREYDQNTLISIKK